MTTVAPPIIDLSAYSRSQTLDARAAMARAVVKKLQRMMFRDPYGHSVQLAEVFEAWPSAGDRFIPPAAVVLPGPWLYDAARLTPTLMEDTWEPRGQRGWGLYKLADISLDFEILIRAASDAERSVIVQGFEVAWVADEVTSDPVEGARYGIVLPMPEYWGICAEFALKSARVLDDEDRAMREHREVIFTINGVAPQVKVAPVRPMSPTVRVIVNDPNTGVIVDC
jgi:hypothetical protein